MVDRGMKGKIHLWGTQIVECPMFCDTAHSLSGKGRLTHAPMSAQGVLLHIP